MHFKYQRFVLELAHPKGACLEFHPRDLLLLKKIAIDAFALDKRRPTEKARLNSTQESGPRPPRASPIWKACAARQAC